MKLKSKLVMGNMLMVILTMGSLTFSQLLIYSYYGDEILVKTSDNISERFVAHARSQAEQTVSYLSEALLNPMYFYDIETIRSLIEPALRIESVIAIKVFDTTGLVIHTGKESDYDYGMPLDMPLVEEAVLGNKRAYTKAGSSELTIARPLTMNKKLLGGLVMTYSLKAVQKDIADNKSIIKNINGLSRQYSTALTAIVTIVMCLVSLFLSILIASTLINPITKLLWHSRRISKGEYQVPNNIHRNDELGELASAFDEMDTNLKERNEAIEFLAYNDPLTELPNRTQFLKFLESQINSTNESDEAFAVFFIDLDEFKRINDNLGHQAGDELLCEAASILRGAVQKTQTIHKLSKLNSLIARVGGDEFLLCLSGVNNPESVSKFASEIVNVFKQSIYLRGSGEFVVVGASVGIALYPDSGNTPEDLVKNADIAMYTAKSNGKGGFCQFNYEMERQVLSRGLIERELRSAIVDFSQFQLFYQPKIDLKTGDIVGAEALLRWQHPNKGSISPAEFIPIAEATGIIHPLGEWIVQQACRDIQNWSSRAIPPDFYVALNLSPKQLYGSKVFNILRQQLKRYSLEASRLHVEVTETALMLDKHSAKETLDSLRNIGIKVWLDDFGTGYSSLGYLREFNIDGLKIDRSFVSDIDTDSNDRSLCSAIISMAHQLGIKVVAEGIETTTQSSFLSDAKCDYGQGYLFAKPMPARELEQKLRGTLTETPNNVIYIK